MCKVDHTYWVSYKDINVPVTLRGFDSYGGEPSRDRFGDPTFRMFIGQRYIGNHWCVHCKNTRRRGIYDDCEACVGSEYNKITRALNMLYPNGSKLRGDALRQVFKDEFGVCITIMSLELVPPELFEEWMD